MKKFYLFLFMTTLIIAIVSCERIVLKEGVDIYYVQDADLLLCVKTDSVNLEQIIYVCDYLTDSIDSSSVLGSIKLPINSIGVLYLPHAKSESKYAMVYGEQLYLHSNKACIVRLSKHSTMFAREYCSEIEIPLVKSNVSDKLKYLDSTLNKTYLTSFRDNDVISIRDFKFPKDLDLMFHSQTPINVSNHLIIDENEPSFVYRGNRFVANPLFDADGLFSRYTYGSFYLNPFYPNCVFYSCWRETYDCFLTDSVSVIEIPPLITTHGLKIMDMKTSQVNSPWIQIDVSK